MTSITLPRNLWVQAFEALVESASFDSQISAVAGCVAALQDAEFIRAAIVKAEGGE